MGGYLVFLGEKKSKKFFFSIFPYIFPYNFQKKNFKFSENISKIIPEQELTYILGYYSNLFQLPHHGWSTEGPTHISLHLRA